MLEDPILQAVVGGALLGLACSISYLVLAKILGMSGAISTIIRFQFDLDFKRKLALVGGMLVASSCAYIFFGMKENFVSSQEDSAFLFLVSGFLVGLGTRLGSGCTSGHGLCGLPRFSLRSITAVLVFLTTGIATASLHLKKHIFAVQWLENLTDITFDPEVTTKIALVGGILLFVFAVLTEKDGWKESWTQEYGSVLKSVVNFIVGAIFSLGLLVSGMTRREKVNGFLDLSQISQGIWDMSLLAVLMTGVGINLVTFNFGLTVKGGYMLTQYRKSLTYEQLPNPKGPVTLRLVFGAMLFGIGWGLGSMCPGPVLALLPVYQLKVHGVWLFGCIGGMYIVGFYDLVAGKKKQE